MPRQRCSNSSRRAVQQTPVSRAGWSSEGSGGDIQQPWSPHCASLCCSCSVHQTYGHLTTKERTMSALLGYVRISTKEQKFDLQRDALLAAGVDPRYLYQDVASGMKQARPGLLACLKALQPGNTLVVWRLDRLARSLLHLLEMFQDFEERGVTLKVLEGLGAQLNVSTIEGRLFVQLLGAFAEFERALIKERVVAGLQAARARGHKGGRRPKLSPAQQRQAQSLKRGGMSITEIAQTLQCSRHTIEFIPIKAWAATESSAPGRCAGHNRVP